MTRAARSALCVALLAAVACDGREVTVFDLPAKLDSAGSSGAGGSSSAAGAAGTTPAPPSGASNGGSSAGVAGLGAGGSGSDIDIGGSNVSGAGGLIGTAGVPPTPCTTKADCAPGWTCDRRGCDAPKGLCVPWPAICLPNPAPVCGCDGVTYWSDCIRLQSEAVLAGPDQCRATACTCEVGSDCNVPYASCSHLLAPGEMCGHGMGNCWVLPPTCEPSADSKMWHECKPPEPGMTAKCINTCEAIASEHSYAELHRGDTCN
jgi:hypothetical protein